MRKIFGLIIAILLSISITYAESQDNISLSFIQIATGASLQKISGKSGYYTLTLTGISPYMTYFAERPNHSQGVMPVENFIKNWGAGTNNFADNPPNAVLTGAQINNNTNQNSTFQLLILQSPVYNKKNSTLSFTVKPVSSQEFFYNEIKYYYALLIIDGTNANILK